MFFCQFFYHSNDNTRQFDKIASLNILQGSLWSAVSSALEHLISNEPQSQTPVALFIVIPWRSHLVSEFEAVGIDGDQNGRLNQLHVGVVIRPNVLAICRIRIIRVYFLNFSIYGSPCIRQPSA